MFVLGDVIRGPAGFLKEVIACVSGDGSDVSLAEATVAICDMIRGPAAVL